jgi:FkbM family methyltransferase
MSTELISVEQLSSTMRSLSATVDSGEPVQSLNINAYRPVYFSNTIEDKSENLPGGGCSNWISSSYLNNEGIYEPAVTAAFIELSKSISTVKMLDIGALWGHTSFVAGAIFPNIVSHMFEMNPFTCEVLQRNIALNQSNTSSYYCNNVLLANKTTETDVVFRHYTARYGEKNEGGSNLSSFKILRQNLRGRIKSFVLRKPNASYLKRRMRIAKIDDYLTEINFQPNVIKIDVEGSQYDILSGAEQYIRDHHPVLIIEFDDPQAANHIGKSNRDVVELLDKYGYKCIWGDHRSRTSKFHFIDSKTELPIESNSLGVFF